MTSENNLVLWDEFFALDTVGGLRRFHAGLDTSTPQSAALTYFISTWPTFIEADDAAPFSPGVHLSPDRTGVLYGKAPVIFEGTNQWAWKPYLPAEDLIAKMNGLRRVVTSIREENPDKKMTLVLIPEKDYVISSCLLKENRFARFDAAVDHLRKQMAEINIDVVFQQPFYGLEKFQTIDDFTFKDSHLAGRNYVTVFGQVVETMGLSWASFKSQVRLVKVPEFGDLATKFENGTVEQTMAFHPDVIGADVKQTAGSETFADPLGDTWQQLQNAAPLADRSVCILGDSHSSIFAQRKLTYLFASLFRETHFEWNPCGTRKKPDVAKYDHVILEISSRFMV